MRELSPSSAAPASDRDIYTVSRLNVEARATLEGSFPPLLWVEGEISNLARPSSGHLYFSLKDARCQVRCAMFRGRNLRLKFVPDNGTQVLAQVKVSLYEGRGEFQLVVEHMEEAGDGLLRVAFEQLKRRLDAEGLFDEAHKKPLPRLPRRIGVVTSPTGAAIRDIITVLRRRFPAIPVVIYPSAVQGDGAAQSLARAIDTAAVRNECDVLIVARGGGSLEDLWAFNEEPVARAIHRCPIPVVSGVGHEVDVTIADLVADRRAPTPSAAAELVVPDQNEWGQLLRSLSNRLANCMWARLQQKRQTLVWLEKRFAQQHPARRLQMQSQRVDELEQRLVRCQGAHLRNHQVRVQHLHKRLVQQHPERQLQRQRERIHQLQQRMQRAQHTDLRRHEQQVAQLMLQLQRHAPIRRMERLEAHNSQLAHRLTTAMHDTLSRANHRLALAMRSLHTVSPLATLDRGYAVVRRDEDGRVVRHAQDVSPGSRVRTRLARGELVCTVNEALPHDETKTADPA